MLIWVVQRGEGLELVTVVKSRPVRTTGGGRVREVCQGFHGRSWKDGYKGEVVGAGPGKTTGRGIHHSLEKFI